MHKASQLKNDSQHSDARGLGDDITSKLRLNLNDLLKRRSEERLVEKKTNLLILSAVSAVAMVVLIALNLWS